MDKPAFQDYINFPALYFQGLVLLLYMRFPQPLHPRPILIDGLKSDE